MTTSGSTSYNPVRDTIVRGALRLVNAYASTGNPAPEQMQDALEALNILLKSWQVEGFLWLKQFATLFLVPGQAQYLLPGANCTAAYVETTMKVATTAYPQTVLSVTSTAGMNVGDNIGVALDANNIFWATIALIGSSTSATLTTGVPSLASIGRPVYAYTKAISRPTRVLLPTRRTYGGVDLPLGDTGQTITREEYNALPNKNSPGVPLMAFYDPQLATGSLYLWPVPNDCRDKVIFTCDRPIEDMVSDTDTFDVPQEQIRRIKYALALEIAPEYALPSGDYDRMSQRYKEMTSALNDYDSETGPTQIMMARY